MIGQRALRRLMDPNLNLSPEARTLIVHVGMQGEEGIEINATTLHRLLQAKDPRVVRRAVADAADAGWLEYNPNTGRGHAPHFRFRDAKNAHPSDRCAENAHLNPDEDAENAHLNASSRARSLSGVREEIVEDGDDDEDARVRRELAEVEAMLSEHGDQLNGCRGALRDYLAKRVDRANRSAYTYAVLNYLDDPLAHFRLPSGRVLEPPERTKMLSKALNELSTATEGAGGDKGYRWPPGDIRNLKTKLNILRGEQDDHERDGNRSNGRGRGAGGAERGGAEPAAGGEAPDGRRRSQRVYE